MNTLSLRVPVPQAGTIRLLVAALLAGAIMTSCGWLFGESSSDRDLPVTDSYNDDSHGRSYGEAGHGSSGCSDACNH